MIWKNSCEQVICVLTQLDQLIVFGNCFLTVHPAKSESRQLWFRPPTYQPSMDPTDDNPVTVAFLHGLGGDYSSPLSKAGDALWARTGVLPHTLQSSLPSPAPRSIRMVDQYTSSFNRMFYLDYTRKGYREQAAAQMDQLVKGGPTAEMEAINLFDSYIQSLSQHVKEISLIDVGTGGACNEYKAQVLAQLQADIALFKSARSTLQRRVHLDDHKANRIDMGTCCNVAFVC